MVGAGLSSINLNPGDGGAEGHNLKVRSSRLFFGLLLNRDMGRGLLVSSISISGGGFDCTLVVFDHV